MKIDRLIGILSVLLQKSKLTSAELADRFEVSRRTINRDIEALCKAGIPIVTAQGNGGGISIMDGYTISRTLLTSSDMKAIIAGLQGLDSVSGTNTYRMLMEKLSCDSTILQNSDNNIIIDLSYWDKSDIENKIQIINSAIENSEKITFFYYSPQNKMKRTIEPYHLIFQWASWYVWGFCIYRQDYRMFKLTRMTDIAATGDKCEKREVPLFTSDKLRHTKGNVKATIKFSSNVKWRLVDEFGIDRLTEQEDGSIIINLSWTDPLALYEYILSFGIDAEIIEPHEYRKDFAKLLKKISSKYQI